MKLTPKNAIIGCILTIFVFSLHFIHINRKDVCVDENQISTENLKNVEILNYNEYIQQAKERIKKLEKTIKLLKCINGKSSAYYFMLKALTNTDNLNFYVDIESLTGEEKSTISVLTKKMDDLNVEAFNEAKKACARVVEADGYGSTLLLRYYKVKLKELNCSVPIP